MTRVIAGEDQGEYPPPPDNVEMATVSTKSLSHPDSVKTFTDYFITGTVPEFIDLGVEELDVCFQTGYLATPWCPDHGLREYSTINSSGDDDVHTNEAPEFYCHKHNLNPAQFPPNPLEKFDENFGKAKVPDLTGLTFKKAESALKKAKLVVGEYFLVIDNPENSPLGVVVSQNPAPGERIPEGSMVNITLSGAEPEDDEDVEGHGIAVAPVVPIIQNPFFMLYSALRSIVAS
ncbi:MAG: PASTA domain-containing protein, partial [Kiritimatiellaeota bacterium]|nr:PASTA domain-containing protein [Kiritimatiellota bacterium]